MQVVVPMAGAGERFEEKGYREPKPLIDVGGRPMIARLLDRFPRDWSFVFICRSDHLKSTPLARVLRAARPKCRVVAVGEHYLGPVHTLNLAAAEFDDGPPTLVNYCDFDFVWDARAFARRAAAGRWDGAVLGYRGFHPHRFGERFYALCRTRGDRVLAVKEKHRFTETRLDEFASSGSYYFKTGALAKRYLARAEAENHPVAGEFYVSEVYNLMVADGLDVRAPEIPVFMQWGTPDDLEDYLYWERALGAGAWTRSRGAAAARPRVLMPMAGRGSRLKEPGAPAKPLRLVGGAPMFARALSLIPGRVSGAVLVARAQDARAVKRAARGAEVLAVGATSGAAQTCLAARGRVKESEPVLVTACDHGLRWDERRWEALLAARPDVVVFGQRGYPGARRGPAAYSYIEANARGRVRSIAVKPPGAADRRGELLLVGTFYFREARVLFDACARLMKSRRAGEPHVDAAAALCVEAGLDVRSFETEAYFNWGDSWSLREFEYWERHFREDA